MYKNSMSFSKFSLSKITFREKSKSAWCCSVTVLISVRMIKSKVQKAERKCSTTQHKMKLYHIKNLMLYLKIKFTFLFTFFKWENKNLTPIY